MQAAPGTEVSFTLSERHFPAFLGGKELVVDSAELVAVIDPDESVGSLAFTMDGSPVGGFVRGTGLGGLPAAVLPWTGAAHRTTVFTVLDAGDLADGTGIRTLDDAVLDDLLLVLRYTVS